MIHGALPSAIHDNPKARMYGYKMADYRDHEQIKADIQLCELKRRWTVDIGDQLQRLADPQWVRFEDILREGGFGEDLDIVRRPHELGHVYEEIKSRLIPQRSAIAE